MGSNRFFVAFFGIIVLLETVSVSVQAQCPVVKDFSVDGHLYVTNIDDLTEDCKCFSVEYEDGVLCSSDLNTSDFLGVLGDFECGGQCHGYIMNPSYVFWDASINDWKKLDVCEDTPSIVSCANMYDMMDCNESYCANGVFKCEKQDGSLCGGTVETKVDLKDCPSTITVSTGSTAMDTLKYIFTPEGVYDLKIHGIDKELYTAITHYRTCTGRLEYSFDLYYGDYCPPTVVSSFQEIEHYCMHGEISTFDDGRYTCEFKDKNDCTGRIDPILVPQCQASTIASCADDQYYQSCTHEVVGVAATNGETAPEYVKFCAGGAFHCWDSRADQWCQGKVVPTFGSFDAPVCPSKIASCESLEQFGINHQDCNCFDMNGEGGFVCGDWDTPYCKGAVDDGATIDNTEITPIEGFPNSGSSGAAQPDGNGGDQTPDQPDAGSDNQDADDNPADDMNEDVVVSSTQPNNSKKMKNTLIPVFIVSALALVAVFAFSYGYRRYKAKKKVEMRREDLAAALELTAHYRGDEDIDFIQQPRRLMIL